MKTQSDRPINLTVFFSLIPLLALAACLVERSDSRACQTDADCFEGEFCVNQICAARCLSNSDCLSGEVCSNGRCLADPDTGPQPDAGTDADTDLDAAKDDAADVTDVSTDTGPQETVSKPHFDPHPGIYINGTVFSLAISSPTEDAQIYYTTDSTTPSRASSSYTGTPIMVNLQTIAPAPYTIKAIAVKDGLLDSAVVTGEYSLPPPGYLWHEATSNAPFGPRKSHACLVFKEKIWVIGGFNGSGYLSDVWSFNGFQWTAVRNNAIFGIRGEHGSMEFDNRMWVIGGFVSMSGFKNDAYYSYNGDDWTLATNNGGFYPRDVNSNMVYDNKMWVIGGYTEYGEDPEFVDDVWYSANGVKWELFKSGAAFGKRGFFSSVVFDDRMWVIAGTQSNLGTVSDVWYSGNGKDWFLTTSNAQFGKRTWHASVVFHDQMFVIGGYENPTVLNDVWASNNGVNFNRITSSAQFPKRQQHCSVVFDNKIWVIGGGDNGVYSDVWWSE